MIIRKIKKSEAQAYRRIRLEALREYPQSFGSSYEEQAELEKLYFERLIEEESPAGAMAVAYDEEELIGICGILYSEDKKEGEIVQLYVRRGYQGRSLGRKFIEEIMRVSPGVERFTLGVKRDNLSAVKVYREMGFEEMNESRKEAGDTVYMACRKEM